MHINTFQIFFIRIIQLNLIILNHIKKISYFLNALLMIFKIYQTVTYLFHSSHLHDPYNFLLFLYFLSQIVMILLYKF